MSPPDKPVRRGGVSAAYYVLHIDGAPARTLCGRLALAVNRTLNPEREPPEALCRVCRKRKGTPP